MPADKVAQSSSVESGRSDPSSGRNDLPPVTPVSSIEALQQIKKNLQRGDHEGFMEAQIYFGTLMSPIWDMIPAQVVNYLAKGDDSSTPDAA